MSIAGTKAWVQRNVPVAFTASTRFQSSSVILASGALCAAPALLTRMSTTPARRAAAWARLWTLAASVASHRPRLATSVANLRGHLLDWVGTAGSHHDGRALGGERACDCCSDALTASRHYRDRAVKSPQ